MASSKHVKYPIKYVCIVGAGISGLRAAGALVSSGYKVLILEARDRIGGRIHQSSGLGYPVDLGASWIHGTVGNPLVDLADKTGSVTSACGAVYSIFDGSGRYMDKKVARVLYEQVWEVLEEMIVYSRREYAEISPEATMREFFEERVKQLCITGRVSPSNAAVINMIVEMWGAFMGADYQVQSLKNMWLDQGVDGDNLFVASTFKEILDEVAKPALEGAELRLASEVTSIVNVQNIATTAISNPKVRVTTRNGFEELFDHVIVTAPLGWLKRNQNIFSPPLPAPLSHAIDHLGYGNLEKVFIRFPKAFWNDKDDDPYQGDLPDFPIETLFLSPDYAPDTNPNRYRQEIISLSGLPDKYAQPVIMFFTYGSWGRHISSLVRGKSQESPEVHAILDTHFQPYYSRLPHYHAGSPDCVPTGFLTTDWQDDEFAGHGSFCNFPVHLEDGARDLEVLRKGIGEERGVWFAGEHVAPGKGIGTVMGAYLSGEDVAKRLIKYVSSGSS